MSSRVSKTSEPLAAANPEWLGDLLGVELPEEGETVEIRGQSFLRRDGILRAHSLVSDEQAQTSDAFGFKWAKRDTFESAASLERINAWLLAKYGNVADAPWWEDYGDRPILLDGGCGAAVGCLSLFPERLPRVRFLGVDVSDAIDVAASRFAERGIPGAAFMQADIVDLPIPEESVDVIFSEGVLHHTDSTERALKGLAKKLRPGGRFLFYVYRRKGPIREFSDDYIRERLQDLDEREAWEALEPLTRLGQRLGELDIEVEVPEEVDLLGIPAGPISIQRLFYWHVFKAYYAPELSFEELNHINYDWYAPMNAHRQSPEEVRAWCADAGLEIEHEHLQEAGITVIARRRP